MYPCSLTAVIGTPNTTPSSYNIIDINNLYNNNIVYSKLLILGATNLPLILNPLLLSSKSLALNPLLLSSKPLALNLGDRVANMLKQITLNTSN